MRNLSPCLLTPHAPRWSRERNKKHMRIWVVVKFPFGRLPDWQKVVC
jgi:hypothetical protein